MRHSFRATQSTWVDAPSPPQAGSPVIGGILRFPSRALVFGLAGPGPTWEQTMKPGFESKKIWLVSVPCQGHPERPPTGNGTKPRLLGLSWVNNTAGICLDNPATRHLGVLALRRAQSREALDTKGKERVGWGGECIEGRGETEETGGIYRKLFIALWLPLEAVNKPETAQGQVRMEIGQVQRPVSWTHGNLLLSVPPSQRRAF